MAADRNAEGRRGVAKPPSNLFSFGCVPFVGVEEGKSERGCHALWIEPRLEE